jgi:hypothetical protein
MTVCGAFIVLPDGTQVVCWRPRGHRESHSGQYNWAKEATR